MSEKQKNTQIKLRFGGKGVFWGVILILSAVLIILDALGTGLGFLTGVPAIRIVLGVICAAWAVSELVKLKISHIFFPLAFVFMLFESKIAELIGSKNPDLISNWLLLLCALLLTIGTSIIFKRKPKYDFSANAEFSSPKKSGFFGNNTQYFDAGDFEKAYVENNMGKTEVLFSNIENYLGKGTLTVENNMGKIVVNVPREWNVYCNIENNMGVVHTPDIINADGKVLNIDGENNMGDVEIKYV